MANDSHQPRRVRVERNIYRRANGVYEIGFKDGSRKQRWKTVQVASRPPVRFAMSCLLVVDGGASSAQDPTGPR